VRVAKSYGHSDEMVSVRSERIKAALTAPDVHEFETCDAKRELRVLQVFSALGVGGAETWLMSLLRYFHQQGDNLPVKVKFDILLTGGAKAVFDDDASALGARLFYAPFERRKMVGFIREFRKILAGGKYDAIHDHQDYIAGLHFLLGAGLLPPARIAHVHNPRYHRNSYATGFIRQIANSTGKWLIPRLATHVMGTSRQILTEYGFHKSLSDNVVFGAAHCGFDVRPYLDDREETHRTLCAELGWPEAAKVVLFVGRLEGAEVFYNGRLMSHKNPAFALEIVRECIEQDADIHLAMVGDGEEKKKEMEAAVAGWGLGDNIRFLGLRNDVARLMLGSDLLLFPSMAEGLGMVVVEAQAAGLRVLASDSTPRESVVIPELISFLPLTAGQSQWAAAALHLLNLQSPNVTRCNAKVRDSVFSIENSAAKLVRLYSGSR
jgi:glycosyltransferase involved in cell wall biosynthesis